jgi:hypothetical protein
MPLLKRENFATPKSSTTLLNINSDPELEKLNKNK